MWPKPEQSAGQARTEFSWGDDRIPVGENRVVAGRELIVSPIDRA